MKERETNPAEDSEKTTVTPPAKKSAISKKVIMKASIVITAALLLIGGLYGYTYASTPEHIRKPKFQHYHFRTQILVDGQAVDFSKDEFQVETDVATSCNTAVGSVPIDFHDSMDQMTHVHWAGMTGGEFLKLYGWNFIGGDDELLGRRYDAGLMPQPVKIFGKLLPGVPEKTNYYIYIGDKNGYQQKNWNDFLNQDLEQFFGKQSSIGHEEVSSTNILSRLFPKAYAHGGEADEVPSDKSEEELTRINNLIGNVVIFAQQNEPASEQVRARFDNLVPLSDSTCGD